MPDLPLRPPGGVGIAVALADALGLRENGRLIVNCADNPVTARLLVDTSRQLGAAAA